MRFDHASSPSLRVRVRLQPAIAPPQHPHFVLVYSHFGPYPLPTLDQGSLWTGQTHTAGEGSGTHSFRVRQETGIGDPEKGRGNRSAKKEDGVERGATMACCKWKPGNSSRAIDGLLSAQ